MPPRSETNSHDLPVFEKPNLSGLFPPSAAPPSTSPTSTRRGTEDTQMNSTTDDNNHSERKQECFFKVVDMRTDGLGISFQKECYSDKELESFYKEIPTQGADTIRVILDGRPFAETILTRRYGDPELRNIPSECWTSSGWAINPADCPLYASDLHYRRLEPHSLPVLRKLESADDFREWFSGKAYAWHDKTCLLRPKNMNLFESQRYETTPLAFITDWSVPDKLKGEYLKFGACHTTNNQVVVCFSPNAHVIGAPQECSSASWRWLQAIDRALKRPRLLCSLTEHDQKLALRLLILTILSATMDRSIAFLREMEGVTNAYDEFDSKSVCISISTPAIKISQK